MPSQAISWNLSGHELCIAKELKYKALPDNLSCKSLALFPKEFKLTVPCSEQEFACSWLMLIGQSY
jgi:hypothetical protein